MFLTNILLKKVKSKSILVICESLSGHRLYKPRERTGEKLEFISKDPFVRRPLVYKEIKKLKGIKERRHCMASPRSGNLTGAARVLNDLIVNFHNTVQNWRSLLIDGIKIVQSIQENLMMNEGMLGSFRDNADLVEKNCENMGILVDNMRNYIQTLNEYSNKVLNLSILHKNSPSPCYSWSFDTMAKSVQEVTDAYAADTDFKDKIVRFMQSKTLQQMNIIAVFWVHSGIVNSHIDATLEAILRECMLKV